MDKAFQASMKLDNRAHKSVSRALIEKKYEKKIRKY